MGKRIIESPVPFALRKIFIEKISGELSIKGGGFEKSLFFSSGDLCFAKTNVLHERLGEVLFKLGKIDKTQFWDIHRLISGQKEKVGKILVDNSIISDKDLHLGLIQQMRWIALSTFALTSGEWNFSPLLPEIDEDSNFKIELPGIFAEGVSHFKSLSVFKNSFIRQQINFKPLALDLTRFFKNEDIELFKKLSFFSGETAEKITRELKIPEDTLWQKLAFFFFINILEFSSKEIDKEVSKNHGDILAFHEKFLAKEMDHYELLNVKINATQNEIKDAYFLYAKRFHPDRLGEGASPDLREKANAVFARINKAYEVLSNDEKRHEYDMKGFQETKNTDKTTENLAEKANLYYRKAKTLYSLQRFREAVGLMEEAIRLDSSRAAYFLLLGLSQFNIPDLRRGAEKSFQKVIAMEPWNAEPYAALGILFQAEKMEKRAENFFRKALAIDPEHDLAKKRLDEMSGSGKKQSVFSVFQKKK